MYLGDELGGYRKGGYEAYLLTKEFLEGLKKLERLPWRCHRRFIGNALKNSGWKVIHIIEKDRRWTAS